jgi:hypothetical protein
MLSWSSPEQSTAGDMASALCTLIQAVRSKQEELSLLVARLQDAIGQDHQVFVHGV